MWGCLSGPPIDEQVTKMVEYARSEHELPAIAVAVIRSEGLVAVEVAGERSNRTHEAAQADDRWHIGACTKAMTASMIASLVERGDLSWDTTVLKVFPELKGVIRREFESVTVEHLLSHRAGVLPFTNPGEREIAIARDLAGDPTQQRRIFLERLLKEEPLSEPGEEWAYSNAGYAVAAAIAEKVTGSSWRDLMIKYVFDPLEMKHSGFGMPLTDDRPNQPWGTHQDARTADRHPSPAETVAAAGARVRRRCALLD